MVSAAFSLMTFSRDDGLPGFWSVLKDELWWLLLTGTPLVGLVHVAMGSFLSMQAYFGSTFLDGTGAVVGVGLLRNLATLMTGLTISGLNYLPVWSRATLEWGQEPAMESHCSRRISPSR